MEDLLIQRQKRIAERSTNNGSKLIGTKKSLSESKSAKTSTPQIRPTNLSPSPQAQKLPKRVLRSSTIERLSAAHITKTVPLTNLKPAEPTKPTSKASKTRTADVKKPISKKIESPKRKNGPRSSGGTGQPKPKGQAKNEALAAAEVPVTQPAPPSDEYFKDIKVLQSTPIEGNGEKSELVTPNDTLDDGSGNVDVPETISPPASVHRKAKSVQFKADPEVTFLSSPEPLCQGEFVQEVTTHPAPSPENLSFECSSTYTESPAEANYGAVVPQISGTEIGVSTPPSDRMNLEELVHSRKRWNSEAKPPKTNKGFRKLLLFGRKSLNSLKT